MITETDQTEAATDAGDAVDDAVAAGHTIPPTDAQIDNLIKTYVISAMALSLVPVPVFDIAALIAVELKLIHALARRYSVRFSENIAKSLVLSLIGGIVPITAVATAGSLLKVFPVIGSLAGGASMAILGGAITYAIGRIFAEHFASGGTLLTFRPADVRERFRDAVKRGKAEAADLNAGHPPADEGRAAASA
ncbi:YcjF family protein [Roseospira visakhapatnamensis]|uniref:Uncharacterized protein (DUF697 family) n=1 Tax=Roseospira visakhapatnamensis TaxID=390880 RepID=A0A7W6R9T9_9PROT|nr:DUF697 domain-containing protein [Roseospira visakhapatnamensis]MBB4264595.1 uncharacterized protein (DUF697 family) [Roseospira visakhapatnamensis]